MAAPSARSKSILLLSSPPSPSTASSLRAAYHDALVATLTRLPSSSLLVIALAASFQEVQWPRLQSLLAGLYSLLATIQSNSGSDIECDVVLVHHKPGHTYPPDGTPSGDQSSIIPDLGTFASTKRDRWASIFHHSTEAGFELVQSFLIVAERTQTILQKQIVAIPGGLSLNVVTQDHGFAPEAGYERSCHKRVILGGTFDHFHPGHRLLLQAAALLLELPRVNTSHQERAIFTIGISSDALLQNKQFASELESWSTRAQSVLNFLSIILSSPLSSENQTAVGDEQEIQAILCEGRLLIRCVNITDVYGPTTREEGLDALVVSGESRGGGRAVNDKRKEQGWHELHVYEVDVLSSDNEDDQRASDDFSAKISSTYFRQKAAEARARTGKM